MTYDQCSGNHPHPPAVDEWFTDETKALQLSALSELFRILGDHTRVRILFALLQAPMCVCDISTALSMTQSAVSHQLRLLRQARLVKSRREGKTIIYSLNDDHIYTLFKQGLEHVQEGSI